MTRTCSRCQRAPVDPRPGNAAGTRPRSRCALCQYFAVLEAGGITEGEQEIRITKAIRELRRQTRYLIPNFGDEESP